MAGKDNSDENDYVSDKTRITRNLIFLGVAIIVVAVLAIVISIVLGVGQPENVAEPTPTMAADDGETNISLAGLPEEYAGSPGALGSGGRYKGDWYELYFTAPAYPDNAANHKGSLDQYLSNFIDTAEHSVDMAIYDFNLQNVADSLVKAQKRGVKVRMVIDSDTLKSSEEPVQKALDKLRTGNIPIVDDNRAAIMHDKFTVVDNKAVSTGSWNYTDGDTYHLNNNVIFIKIPQVAQNYTAEFEKMFTKKQFGTAKDKGSPYPSLIVGNSKIETLFAPEDDVINRITGKINSASSSIYFMAYSFTQKDIGKAILDRAKAGLTVGGVFETTGSDTPYSQFKPMKDAGLEVFTDGNPWSMHHKVIILDDHTTIFGSFNFSDNAGKTNDENLLIIENSDISKAFKNEYDRVLAVAKAKS